MIEELLRKLNNEKIEKKFETTYVLIRNHNSGCNASLKLS